MKYNEGEKVLLKSVEILRKSVATKRNDYKTKRWLQNEMPWPPQASHLTVESFKIPERSNYFLQKQIYVQICTDIDSLRVSCLKISFSQDLIYAMIQM